MHTIPILSTTKLIFPPYFINILFKVVQYMCNPHINNYTSSFEQNFIGKNALV